MARPRLYDYELIKTFIKKIIRYSDKPMSTIMIAKEINKELGSKITTPTIHNILTEMYKENKIYRYKIGHSYFWTIKPYNQNIL